MEIEFLLKPCHSSVSVQLYRKNLKLSVFSVNTTTILFRPFKHFISVRIEYIIMLSVCPSFCHTFFKSLQLIHMAKSFESGAIEYVFLVLLVA